MDRIVFLDRDIPGPNGVKAGSVWAGSVWAGSVWAGSVSGPLGH